MVIKAHLQMCLKLVPRNLVNAAGWHAIGELYHVSQSCLQFVGPNADFQ